jgi:hypothetical protein
MLAFGLCHERLEIDVRQVSARCQTRFRAANTQGRAGRFKGAAKKPGRRLFRRLP